MKNQNQDRNIIQNLVALVVSNKVLKNNLVKI